MFRKFHAMAQKREERGFTLIELLVVILIIAILAAIAIPVFLKQREKGWIAQQDSALKNASTAAESYATGPGNGSYAALGAAGGSALLTAEGLKTAADVTINDAGITVNAAGTKFCISATHAKVAGTKAVSSDDSTPTAVACAALGVKA